MKKHPRYRALKGRNAITVIEHAEDGTMRGVLRLYNDSAAHLAVRDGALVEFRPCSRETTVLIDDTAHDPAEILGAIATAHTHRTWHWRAFIIVVLLLITLIALASVIRSHQVPAPRPFPSLTASVPDAAKPSEKREAEPQLPPAADEQDQQAAAARANLAAILKRNADRGMFTINLSQGNARTLYAFLDPACINCKTLEPALKRLSEAFNVVIYPVSIRGGDETVARVSPLLCEKDAQKRRDGWHGLYRADTGMRVADAGNDKAEDEDCLKAAAAAIGVNNTAMRTFGFAGTPWVLSDTGYHLPSSLLQSADAVHLFLKTTDTEETRREQQAH